MTNFIKLLSTCLLRWKCVCASYGCMQGETCAIEISVLFFMQIVSNFKSCSV